MHMHMQCTCTCTCSAHAHAHAHTFLPAALWESTLLVFVSDNGGPTNGAEGTASNNFPMRGGKNTLWEGGTRVVALVRGAGVGAALRGTVSHGLALTLALALASP